MIGEAKVVPVEHSPPQSTAMEGRHDTGCEYLRSFVWNDKGEHSAVVDQWNTREHLGDTVH